MVTSVWVNSAGPSGELHATTGYNRQACYIDTFFLITQYRVTDFYIPIALVIRMKYPKIHTRIKIQVNQTLPEPERYT